MSLAGIAKRASKTAKRVANAVDDVADAVPTRARDAGKERDRAFLVIIESLVTHVNVPDSEHHPVRVALDKLRRELG